MATGRIETHDITLLNPLAQGRGSWIHDHCRVFTRHKVGCWRTRCCVEIGQLSENRTTFDISIFVPLWFHESPPPGRA
jgi:hypothetical protein